MNDHNRRSDIAEDIFTYKAAKTETGTEEVFLKIKCPHCGTLNLVPVHRIIYPKKPQNMPSANPPRCTNRQKQQNAKNAAQQ
jgi:hypothetical protein